MTDLELGVIGNCSIGALIDTRGRIVWCCLPAFDGDPVFNSLVAGTDESAERGFFDIELYGLKSARQKYVRNTAVLTTTLEAQDGAMIEITDFAPRFRRFGRNFLPTMIVRRLKPLAGTARIRIRLKPTFDYGATAPQLTRGSNHIRYVGPDQVLRLTTDAPCAYIIGETSFILDRPLTLLLGPDESLTQSIEETARLFYDNTVDYWLDWSRALSIPFEWQEAVIRAAITLKLCSYEETGGLVAAMTTSIPEAPGSGRNWDYRYCWLRDSYFTVQALNRLSATRTMERYLAYIGNIVAQSGGTLQPLYSIRTEAHLPERTAPALSGYRGMGPVRIGNQAYAQMQNDVYGAVVLASTHSFFDQRLRRPSDAFFFNQLEPLGERAAAQFDKPDAGIWEYRTRAAVHSYSALMCWAAADRLSRIARALGLAERAEAWRSEADRMHAAICAEAYNRKLGSFTSSFGGSDVDASLFLIPLLNFLPASDPRVAGTVAHVDNCLRRGDFLLRYAVEDDFGAPETAFVVCTFWLIEALSVLGRKEEARAHFETLLGRRTALGLLSEDIDPKSGALWGNFPQTYSMVGLINCAMRLSKSWEEAF
jgi:GH15 family glucan-1,4-alpha-glucosidase